MNVLLKTFLQIILAAKSLVQHSNNNDDLCFSFCEILILGVSAKQNNQRIRKSPEEMVLPFCLIRWTHPAVANSNTS